MTAAWVADQVGVKLPALLASRSGEAGSDGCRSTSGWADHRRSTVWSMGGRRSACEGRCCWSVRQRRGARVRRDARPASRRIRQEVDMAVVEVQAVRKAYDNRPVVDGVSFAVEQGEIFGIQPATRRRPFHPATAAGSEVRRALPPLPARKRRGLPRRALPPACAPTRQSFRPGSAASTNQTPVGRHCR